MVFVYIVLLSKDFISVLFYVYLHWNTIILWMVARDGKIFVDFRYDILSPDAYWDSLKASIFGGVYINVHDCYMFMVRGFTAVIYSGAVTVCYSHHGSTCSDPIQQACCQNIQLLLTVHLFNYLGIFCDGPKETVYMKLVTIVASKLRLEIYTFRIRNTSANDTITTFCCWENAPFGDGMW